jgi:hypothetical protein
MLRHMQGAVASCFAVVDRILWARHTARRPGQKHGAQAEHGMRTRPKQFPARDHALKILTILGRAILGASPSVGRHVLTPGLQGDGMKTTSQRPMVGL